MKLPLLLLFLISPSLGFANTYLNEDQQSISNELAERTKLKACELAGDDLYKLTIMRQQGISQPDVNKEGSRLSSNLSDRLMDSLIEETKNILPKEFWNDKNLELFRETFLTTGDENLYARSVDRLFKRPIFPLRKWQEEEAQQVKDKRIDVCTSIRLPEEKKAVFDEFINESFS